MGEALTVMEGIEAAGLREPFITACGLLAGFTIIGTCSAILGRKYPDSWWTPAAIIAFGTAAFQVFCLGIFLAAAA